VISHPNQRAWSAPLRRSAGGAQDGVRPTTVDDLRATIEAAALVVRGDTSTAGVVIAASTREMLLELRDPLVPPDDGLRIRIETGDGVAHLRATVLRCGVTSAGRSVVSVRVGGGADDDALATDAPGTGRRRRRSRAKPRAPRTMGQVRWELRAAGAVLLDRAIRAPDDAAPPNVVRWVDALGAELGVARTEPGTYRGLMRQLAALHRSAGTRAVATASETAGAPNLSRIEAYGSVPFRTQM